MLALGGKVWSEPRIARQEELRPALHKQRLLALPATQLFLVGLFPAARGELVVVQLGIGRKDGAVARLPYTQAKVYVVKADSDFLVVAVDLLKYVASDHLVGTRYGAKVTRAHSAGKIALTLGREILVGMGECATHANNNASVLHQMIGKVELGAHHTRIGTLQIAHHLFDKVRANNLGIVVEQQQVVALTFFSILILHKVPQRLSR